FGDGRLAALVLLAVFRERDVLPAPGEAELCRVSRAGQVQDAAGNTVGYALSVTSGDGYDGNVTLSLGLDAGGKVLSIAFTELTETPGMGMLADEPAFKDQFANRDVTQFVHNKGGVTGDNVIDAISGASTTSGAVVNAVNAGLDFFHSVMQGGN
ncbi:MAG: FMN-binding protein, partial [Clostridia bacterium]|nr:FMN-binding protein [Clostridia bacterium]